MPGVASDALTLLAAETVAGNAPVSRRLSVADLGGGYTAKLNRAMTSLDLLGRYSVGCACVVQGLELSSSTGLAVHVSAGQAVIDGLVELSQDATLTLPDEARSQVWLLRDGTLWASLTLGSPTQPGAYLGSVLTAGGEVVSIDGSGVMRLVGGLAVRQTADAGLPVAAPPAGMSFVQISLGGAFLALDGAWLRLPSASVRELAMGNADLTVAPEDWGAGWFRFTGTLTADRTVDLGSGIGREHRITNACTGGAVIIGGVSVSAGKTTMLACTDAGWVRVTPEA